MITLEKDCLTITIKDQYAADRWVDTVQELIDVLVCKDEDFTQNHPNVLFLLQEMMPDLLQVKAMYGVKPTDI